MNLDQEFAPLLHFVKSLSPESGEQHQYFQPKPFKATTISQRVATQRKPQPKKLHLPADDDPYNIFSRKVEFCFLTSDYTYPRPPPPPAITQEPVLARQPLEGSSISMTICSLFSEMLERVNRKCINLLSRDRIKDSISRTMRGIKKFMLFEQGDFVQEFLELSQ